jgi:hypothetical protein
MTSSHPILIFASIVCGIGSGDIKEEMSNLYAWGCFPFCFPLFHCFPVSLWGICRREKSKFLSDFPPAHVMFVFLCLIRVLFFFEGKGSVWSWWLWCCFLSLNGCFLEVGKFEVKDLFLCDFLDIGFFVFLAKKILHLNIFINFWKH